MSTTLLLNGILDSIFAASDSLTLKNFLICSAASLVLGVVIALCGNYKSEFRTKSLTTSLIFIPLIVQVIISLVNGNFGVGFAVFGAFSLIRFRSEPASARDMTSLLLAMAVGFANGMGYIGVAVLLTVIVIVFNFIFALIGLGAIGERERNLRIVIPESLNYTEVFESIFKKYTTQHRLVRVKTTNMGSLYKLNYTLVLKDPKKEKEFIDAIRCRNGNLEVICVRGEYPTKKKI